MGERIEADYLVVGAGATGMAITDELLTHTDADIAIVDRRTAPGGHWREAYPFVRLHQPSTFYGVSSTPLGADAIDETGINAGFYELAGVDEIRAYYERVMTSRFLASGRVRYFPGCDYVGDGSFTSHLTGQTRQVDVRRKLIDTTYMEGNFPASSPPPFEVADGVRCVPAGELARVEHAPERFVIVGAGKTALDSCVFLLERGVPPDRIRWIKSREAWWINRHFQQPHTLLPEMYRGNALQIEAMAAASSIQDLFARLEADEVFLRVDPTVPATALRGAVLSETELNMLREIEDVVRMGHVRRIEPSEIVLAEGRVPTSPDTLHVHCAASGLLRRPLVPIFAPGRITAQPTQWGFACYQFALLGVVEAMLDDDDAKNALCRPIEYWDTDVDYLRAFLGAMSVDRGAAKYPELVRWMKSTRLNPASGLALHREDPTVIDARTRVKNNAAAAAQKLQTLLASTR